MKTCRLRVYLDQTVKLSVPARASGSRVEELLRQSAGWIEARLERIERALGQEPEPLCTGATTRLLGREWPIVVIECPENRICLEGEAIRIYSAHCDSQNRLGAQFESWWRRQALDILQQRMEAFYPAVEPYGIPRPKLGLRNMKTQWGSCNLTRGVLTFHRSLVKTSPAFVDYVVLHELAHLVHPNHSRAFYGFISEIMPDWKEREP